ncbi:MAG TPA: SDR family NAD(P)-dependent oxidoreductase [Pyrinomonadaceae bacterium]|jgi:short-subunit dehydrogenase|nr:SDR family NAD(P)-dependent oxidoreductase [Pyrinomonadaceae bacterium]
MKELGSEKVALVTGTSSGIGNATAKALFQAGFHVVATARDVKDIKDLADLGCETAELDVTDNASAKKAVKAAEKHNGSIYLLVNDAGYGQYGPVEEIPLDDIRQQFEVNVFGLIRLCQLVLPGMREAGVGRIVNISSVAGEIKQPGSGIYHATKHAVEAIDGALRTEVEAFGIDVIGILPGPVNTNFDEVAVASIPDTGRNSPYYIFKENLKKTTREMLKPGGTGVSEPEDIAAKVVEAATAESPSTRYHVGLMSKTMSVISGIVPDSVWDAAMKHKIPVNEKK